MAENHDDGVFDSRQRRLHRCRVCGYVDAIDSEDGFWEKGVDEDDNDIFACNGCGSWGQVDEVTLGELRERNGGE